MKTLLIVHGAFEHGDKYQLVADWFRPHGYHCLTPTLRGHGRAPGRSMYIRTADESIADLQQALQQAGVAQPYAILAHSMGGLVALRAVQQGAIRPEKLLLSSPFMATAKPVPGWQKAVARLLARLYEYASLPASIKQEQLTHDTQLVAEGKRDPLIRKWLTVRWYQAIEEAQARCMAEADRVQIPTWIFSAGDDKIVSLKAQQELFARLPQGQQHRIYPGLYHEVMKELERAQVLGDILRALAS